MGRKSPLAPAEALSNLKSEILIPKSNPPAWRPNPMKRFAYAICCALTLSLTFSSLGSAEDQWVVYPGGEGPGKGKHIVLIAGDEEYRSEEALPQLGKILSERHGFRCTVLFSINPEDGTIDPNNQTNIPGLAALDDADMMILALRFRDLPDEDMKHIDDFLQAGKPIMGLRTATHSFNMKRNKESPYAKYDFRSREWPGGFGQQVLGETWISHHGHHKKEATRGVINEDYKDHPILLGVKDVFGPTDVYGVKNLTDDAQVLMHGQVLTGMKPSDPPVDGPKNNPMMPLVWVKNYKSENGETSKVFTTTMGASVDLKSEDFRRLLVNGVYWAVEMADQIPEKANVEIVGEFEPTFYGFGGFTKGVKPSDHALKK
jgi:type 1 glutamine amidotransferase